MKKKIILVALMFALSVQFLHAQQRIICTIDVCDTPTPTPTPIPTPTPTPTPAGGSIAPKYVVLSVTYAPPGSNSFATYSNSTMFGSSISLDSAFSVAVAFSVTDTTTLKPVMGFGSSTSSTISLTSEEELDSSTSIAVTEKAVRTYTIRGPSGSAVGINHDADIIWLWVNPVLNFSIPSPNTLQWSSVGFDNRDPAGDLDIIGIPVAFLNGHAAIPADIADVLARRWAPRILCTAADPACQPDGTKDPGLTAADFTAILAADPFTNPAYLIDVPQGSICTSDGRFCNATTSTFEYAPPPPGQQPVTQTFSETRTVAASQGLGVSVSFQLGLSDEFTTNSSVFNIDFSNALKTTDTLKLTIKLNLKNDQQAEQTSSVSITGPASTDNYTGPVLLNVFQDNVYGTFMFGAIPQPTFNLFVSPASESVSVGNCVDSTVNVGALVTGFNSSVNLSVSSGLPTGVTATFNPNPVVGAGSSTMHVCADPSAPLTNSTLTIRGVVGIEAHTTTAGLAVTDFTLGATPSSQSVVVGGTASYTVSVAALNGFSGAVNLSVCGGAPTGVTPTFTPASITGSGSATFSIATSAATPLGTYTICIAGASGSLTHTTSVSLTVNSVPAGDFTLSATPGSQTVNAGDVAFYTVSTSALNGFNGTVTLSASGPGGDIFVDLSPGSIAGAGSASLSVSTSSTTSAGTYLISITGTSGSLSHTTSVAITVNNSGGCLGGEICQIQ